MGSFARSRARNNRKKAGSIDKKARQEAARARRSVKEAYVCEWYRGKATRSQALHNLSACFLLAMNEAFGFGAINYGFAYILIGIFLSLIQPLTSIIINALSRKFEYRADRQAVKEGYGEAMIGALKKLARENFAELAPTRVSVLLEYSHPPLADRISAVRDQLSKKED